MDDDIIMALDIIGTLYESDDVFWTYFPCEAYGLSQQSLEEWGILIGDRIAIEKDEIAKAKEQRLSTEWY